MRFDLGPMGWLDVTRGADGAVQVTADAALVERAARRALCGGWALPLGDDAAGRVRAVLADMGLRVDVTYKGGQPGGQDVGDDVEVRA